MVQSQPWDLHHHFMGSLDHRSLTSSGSALEGAEADSTPIRAGSDTAVPVPAAAAAKRIDSSSQKEASEKLANPPALLSSLGVETTSSGPKRTDDDGSEEHDVEISDRAEALASAPTVDVRIPPGVPAIDSTLPIDHTELSVGSLHAAPATAPANVYWSGSVHCPGLTSFRARLVPGAYSPVTAHRIQTDSPERDHLLCIFGAVLFLSISVSFVSPRYRAPLLPDLDSAVHGTPPPAALLPPALYLIGRSPFATLLKYAVALEHSSSRTRSVFLIEASDADSTLHFSALFADLLKRERGAACKLKEGVALREAFVLPMSASAPLPSLLGGRPPRAGDLLLLILVYTRSGIS